MFTLYHNRLCRCLLAWFLAAMVMTGSGCASLPSPHVPEAPLLLPSATHASTITLNDTLRQSDTKPASTPQPPTPPSVPESPNDLFR